MGDRTEGYGLSSVGAKQLYLRCKNQWEFSGAQPPGLLCYFTNKILLYGFVAKQTHLKNAALSLFQLAARIATNFYVASSV